MLKQIEQRSYFVHALVFTYFPSILTLKFTTHLATLFHNLQPHLIFPRHLQDASIYKKFKPDKPDINVVKERNCTTSKFLQRRPPFKSLLLHATKSLGLDEHMKLWQKDNFEEP